MVVTIERAGNQRMRDTMKDSGMLLIGAITPFLQVFLVGISLRTIATAEYSHGSV